MELYQRHCKQEMSIVSDDERQRAIEKDSVWTCQWYPNTPVGSCALAASSFEVLMTAIRDRQP